MYIYKGVTQKFFNGLDFVLILITRGGELSLASLRVRWRIGTWEVY